MNNNLSGGWRVYVRTAAFWVAVMYGVGTVGHLAERSLPFLLFLTPCFLLLLGVLVLAPSFVVHGWRFALWVATVCVFTFLLEAAGVATGVIFGKYTYGATLGWAWLGVPLIIGVNWVLTVNGAVCIASCIVPGAPGLRRRLAVVLLTGLLAMVFDFAMEPVAMRLDYWQWAEGIIPLRNYLAWFATAALVATLHPQLKSGPGQMGSAGRLAGMLFISQLLFFLALQLVWRAWES
jgi:bisanhydrobacterioruberin hydratase